MFLPFLLYSVSTIIAPAMVPGGHLLQPPANRRSSYGLAHANNGKSAPKLSLFEFRDVDAENAEQEQCSPPNDLVWTSSSRKSNTNRNCKRAPRGLGTRGRGDRQQPEADGSGSGRDEDGGGERDGNGEQRSSSPSPARNGDTENETFHDDNGDGRDTHDGLFVNFRTREHEAQFAPPRGQALKKNSPIPPPASLETHLSLPAHLKSQSRGSMLNRGAGGGRTSSSVVGRLLSAHRAAAAPSAAPTAAARLHLNTGLTSGRSLSSGLGSGLEADSLPADVDVNLGASMASKRTIKAERHMFRFDDSDEEDTAKAEAEAEAGAEAEEEPTAAPARPVQVSTQSATGREGNSSSTHNNRVSRTGNGNDERSNSNSNVAQAQVQAPKVSVASSRKVVTRDSRRRSQCAETQEGAPAVLELAAADASPVPAHKSSNTSTVSYSSSKATCPRSPSPPNNLSTARPNFLHTSPLYPTSGSQPQSESPVAASAVATASGTRSRIPVLVHSPQQQSSSSSRTQTAMLSSTSAPASAVASPAKQHQLPARALVLDPHSLPTRTINVGDGSASPAKAKASPTHTAPLHRSSPTKSSADSTPSPSAVVQLDLPQDNAGQNGQVRSFFALFWGNMYSTTSYVRVGLKLLYH